MNRPETLRRSSRYQLDELQQLLAELQNAIGFELIDDVRFDPETGVLDFVAPDEADAEVARPRSVVIHEQDVRLLAALSGLSHVTAEVRLAGEGEASFLLIMRENRGGTCWTSGVLKTVREPRYLIEAISTRSRLETLGEHAATVAHELRQPLFTMAMANENMRLLLETPGVLKARILQGVDRISEQIERAQTIVKRTLHFASGIDAVPERSDLAKSARNAVAYLAPLFDATSIAVWFDLPGRPLEIGLGRTETEQIFVNLMRNAAEAITERRDRGWDGEGRIAVEMSVRESGSGQAVFCRITDNGAGLKPEVPDHAFRPFLTTKQADGTGLGLYISERILRRVGGSIRLAHVETAEGRGEGTVAELLVPLLDQ